MFVLGPFFVQQVWNWLIPHAPYEAKDADSRGELQQSRHNLGEKVAAEIVNLRPVETNGEQGSQNSSEP